MLDNEYINSKNGQINDKLCKNNLKRIKPKFKELTVLSDRSRNIERNRKNRELQKSFVYWHTNMLKKTKRISAEVNLENHLHPSKELQTLPEREKPIIEGWLQKWTNILNTWKPRYFQLYPGFLYYLKGSKIKKRFALTHQTCFIDLSSGNCYRISIKYPNNSPDDLHLKAYSLESKLVWANALLYSMSIKIAVFESNYISSPFNSGHIFSPISDSSTDDTLFLPNLLYELIKTRNLLLDEISEKKKGKNLRNTVSKYFDKLIGTMFDITYKKLYFNNFCESDIYSALLRSVRISENSDINIENFISETVTKEFPEEAFFDAYSEVESINLDEKSCKPTVIFPEKDDCLTCFWNKNPYIYRRSLPYLQQKPRFNLWTSIKESIAKDISRITIPIQFNEPTSLLQRLAEDFRYSSILETASNMESSIDRLREVTIFSMTPYASSIGRIYKPFNPLLGETFEFSHRGFRFIAEQVGHHPPVTAFYVEHHPTNVDNETPKIGHYNKPLYCAWGQVGNKSRFTGQSLELVLLGNVNITLNERNDYFTFNRPKLLIHNIIFGKLWIEIAGISTIINHSTSEFSFIEYQKSGWFSSDLFNIRGLIFNKNGAPIYKIGGKWDSKIWYEKCKLTDCFSEEYNKLQRNQELERAYSFQKGDHTKSSIFKSSERFSDSSSNFSPPANYCSFIFSNWDKIETVPNSRKIAWIAEAKPSQSEKYFGFADMTFELNEISPQYDKHAPGTIMPCTDSRYRPDQRAYESGYIEWAIKEKRRLEEKQRTNAKKRINGEADYFPKWFGKEYNSTGKYTWKFNHKYWIHKDQQIEFTDLPNIF